MLGRLHPWAHGTPDIVTLYPYRQRRQIWKLSVLRLSDSIHRSLNGAHNRSSALYNPGRSYEFDAIVANPSSFDVTLSAAWSGKTGRYLSRSEHPWPVRSWNKSHARSILSIPHAPGYEHRDLTIGLSPASIITFPEWPTFFNPSLHGLVLEAAAIAHRVLAPANPS